MCELIQQNEFWVILGTITGFLLYEISDLVKKKRCNREYKNLILDEIDANFHQIIHKIEIVNQIIVALKMNKFLSGRCVEFSYFAFEHHFVKVITKFTPVERDNIRNIYGLLKKADEILNNFDDNYKNDVDNMQVRKNSLDGINRGHQTQLDDLKKTFERTQNIISCFQKGKPIDVYNRNSV